MISYPTRKCVKPNGYSLIELLIVMSLLIIMFFIGQASYKRFYQKQRLENIGNQIKADLRLAQEYASAARKSGSCTRLDGYSFSKNGTTAYEIRQNCDGDNCNQGDQIKIATLPTGLTLSNFSCFRFNVLGRGTDKSGDITIEINLANSSFTKTITVSQYGEIR